MIKTERLQLIVCERAHIEAFLRGRDALAALLGVRLPQGWPHFPEAFALPDSDPAPTGWAGYLFVDPEGGVLVGSGGFKGEPDPAGMVEIGYEIADEYWNRGFATEAARGLIDYAFGHAQVQAVIAHTLAETNASGKVLQKVGMRLVAALDDPEDGRLWQWRIERDAS